VLLLLLLSVSLGSCRYTAHNRSHNSPTAMHCPPLSRNTQIAAGLHASLAVVGGLRTAPPVRFVCCQPATHLLSPDPDLRDVAYASTSLFIHPSTIFIALGHQ
jgi:hypothetical protein